MKKFGKVVICSILIFTVTFGLVPLLNIGNTSTAHAASFGNSFLSALNLRMKSDESVELSWHDVPDADGYRIYKSTSKNGRFYKIADVKSQTCIDKKVKFGKVYYYKYKAYKYVNGKKVYTNYSKVYSKRITLPKSDIKKMIFNGDGTIKIMYDKLKNAEGYKIYYSTIGSKYSVAKTVNKNINETTFRLKTDKNRIDIMVKAYTTINGKKYYSDDYKSYYFFNKNDKYTEVEIKSEEELQSIKDWTYGNSSTKFFNIGAISMITINNCSLKSADDLKFLENCKALKYLILRDCTFDNLNVFDYLDKSKLLSLQICNSPIDSLNGLEKFENLRYLNIERTGIKSIAPVSSLAKLKHLSLIGNEIDSFECLQNLKNLEKIDYSTRPTIQDPYDENRLITADLHIKTNYKGLLEVCEPMGIEIQNLPTVKRKAESEKVMDNFIKENIHSYMTDYEKIKEAHDFVVTYLDYDYDAYYFNTVSMGNSWVTKKGLCGDYARCFKDLVERMGIYCEYVISDYGQGHAWNIVLLDDKYYHVDCTWDDSKNGKVMYTYFLISDATINAKRYFPWDTTKYPKCISDYLNAVA